MRRRFGLPVPLEVRYDEFTFDIAENRILRAATERLLALPQLPLLVRRSLRRLLRALAEVSRLPRGLPPPSWRETRLNARYVVALRLAEVVLAGQSFEQRRGDRKSAGSCSTSPRVFEDFVCGALREQLVTRGGRVELQYRTHLDVDARVRMRPDLVWFQRGRPAAVVDAKYKSEKPQGFPDVDLYQLLAYCSALRLSVGHLVYAKGNERPARYRVRASGVKIVCHALDLDREPVEVLYQLRALAHVLISNAGVLSSC